MAPLACYLFINIKLAAYHLLLYVVYMCQKSSNFVYTLICYKQKCKVVSLNLAHPVYRPIISLADRAILQKDINTLYNWSQTLQMCFNAKKCHILNISRKRQKPCLRYQLGQEALSVVDSYPYLGVTISSDLRWHEHINNISAKATRTLNFVRRNIYSCSPEAKALAYTSLVRPHLE